MDASPLLTGTGLTVADLDVEEGHVASWQEFAFVRNLLRMCGDPLVSLEAGSCYRLGCFGVMGLGVATANTLWEGLVFLFNHLALSFTQFQVEVRTPDSDWIHIGFKPLTPLGDLQAYFLQRDIACTVGMVRDLAASQRIDTVMRLHTQRQDRIWRDAVQRTLKMDIHANRESDGDEIRLYRPALALPLALANPLQHRVLQQQCFAMLHQRRLRYRQCQTRVWQLLAAQHALPSMETVARELAVSPRTPRRKLAEEGTHFQALLDQFRQSQARQLLLTSSEPVEQLAARLGYSEASTFVHAFKRWTGKTPGQFRRRER
ncbi:Putative transcriptional regulator [gamma proteobacterium HdN1]|nr:Putative transcriptional regulator [gamma proteobacterium HdN1]